MVPPHLTLLFNKLAQHNINDVINVNYSHLSLQSLKTNALEKCF